jgi:universal stress protein E
MPPLKSILVMAERAADAQVALQKAFVLARHFGARIDLLSCDPDQPWSARAAHQPEAAARAAAELRLDSRRFLAALRSSISAEDLLIQNSDDLEGPLHEGIASKVQSGGHHLVVRRLNRREGRRRPSLTPLDWQVIRACPVPLMLTRGRPWRPSPRIVATLAASGEDGPRAHREVLDVAQYLARCCQGALEVVADAPRHRDGDAGIHPDSAAVGDPAAAADAEAALARLAAPSDIDVVVLRACGRLPGASTAGPALAQAIVDSLDCDVLLVPSRPH